MNDVFPTKDTMLSKAKSLQKEPTQSRSETLLAQRRYQKYGPLRPPEETEETKAAYDWLMKKFYECFVERTEHNHPVHGRYETIRVYPTPLLWGGNHGQPLFAYKEENIGVGEDSEWVTWGGQSGVGDAFGQCFHEDGCPIVAERQRVLAEQRRLREQRDSHLQSRQPQTIIIPTPYMARPVAPNEPPIPTESFVTSVEWVPHTDWLRDIIWYEVVINGSRYSVRLPAEAWYRTTDAQLLRVLRNETRRLLLNEDDQNRNA